MRYLPLHFDLQDRHVLVVGGGEVARRKVELLVSAKARVTLVAPAVITSLVERLKGSSHRIVYQEYEASMLDAAVLVVAATNDPVVNASISTDARDRNIPVNVVDVPELCTVTFPAIIDRDPLVVSVGTAGGSPVLTRHVRELVEQILPDRISTLARFLQRKRAQLIEHFGDVEQRRRQTEAFIASPGAEYAMQGRESEAEAYLFESEDELVRGEVYLVGAGPGDPDLLTLRALQLLQKANVVLYDNLVPASILDRTRRDATREFVGKRSGYKSKHEPTLQSTAPGSER